MYSVWLHFLMKRYKISVWNSAKEETETLKKNQKLFKKCSFCGKNWSDRDHFLSDPDVVVVGYQVHFSDLNRGLFLFNHVCGTSLAIYTGEFIALFKGSFLSENKRGTDECPEYCLRQEELRPCPAKCECSYVRDVLHTIHKWPKKNLNKEKTVSRLS